MSDPVAATPPDEDNATTATSAAPKPKPKPKRKRVVKKDSTESAAVGDMDTTDDTGERIEDSSAAGETAAATPSVETTAEKQQAVPQPSEPEPTKSEPSSSTKADGATTTTTTAAAAAQGDTLPSSSSPKDANLTPPQPTETTVKKNSSPTKAPATPPIASTDKSKAATAQPLKHEQQAPDPSPATTTAPLPVSGEETASSPPRPAAKKDAVVTQVAQAQPVQEPPSSSPAQDDTTTQPAPGNTVASADADPPPTPPAPPTPLSEEEILRRNLADAVKYLTAVQHNTTPSPFHRQRNADAAERFTLSCAESRYLAPIDLASPSKSYEAIATQLSPLAKHRLHRPSPKHPLSAPSELPASPSRHRALPPMNSSIQRSPSSLLSASPSQGLSLNNSRVANAALAMSTKSRSMPERDEKQEAEVELAHALQEHALVSHRHAIMAADYANYVARKTALADEENQHRIATNDFRKELRVAQAALLDAEKRILVQHGKLRDLVLKLQRSRLRMTKEEAELTSQLQSLRKTMKDLERTARDEDAQFDAAMDATSKRAADLEHQLKFFDADAYVEDVELGDLRDTMQKQSLGISQALTAPRTFKPFHYVEGTGWASNAAAAATPQQPVERPTTTSSVASSGAPSAKAPNPGPTAPPSSVTLLTPATKTGAGAKKAHPAVVSTTDAEAKLVLEMLESGAHTAVSVTDMPPTARLEHALKAYKNAVQGSGKDQARLRKFLAGEF